MARTTTAQPARTIRRPRYSDSRAAAQREARAIVADLVDYATAQATR